MKTTWYKSDGSESSESIDRACCYKVEHEQHTRYYVLMYSSQLYDPRNANNPGYNTRFTWRHRPVNASVFSLYIRFLKTKHDYLLTNAARGI
jgi:hypothetical protein